MVLTIICMMFDQSSSWAQESQPPSSTSGQSSSAPTWATQEMPMPEEHLTRVDATEETTKETVKEAQPELIPPQAQTSLVIPYPPKATTYPDPITIRVLLTIDAQGYVNEVEVTSKRRYPLFERAVIKGARQFRFIPAKLNGKSVN